jgi:hypothetical protein
VIVETPGIGQGDAAIVSEGALAPVDVRHSSGIRQVVPADRVRCLAEITDIVRGYHTGTDRLSEAARRVRRLEAVRDELAEARLRRPERRVVARRPPQAAPARDRREDREVARDRGLLGAWVSTGNWLGGHAP